MFKIFRKISYKLPVRYRGALIIAIPAACLLTSLIAWVWSREIVFQVNQQINKTRTIILNSNQVLKILLDAETGSRGYILSRNREFLQPYNQGVQELPKTLEKFQNNLLTTSQIKEYQNIENLSSQLLDSLEQRHKLNQREQTKAEQIEMLEQSKSIMDNIRVVIDNFQTEEWDKLESHRQDLNSIYNKTQLIISCSFLMSIISYLAAIYLFNKLDWQLKGKDLELYQSENLLQGILSNVVDGVIILNHSGKIDSLNTTALKMFGYESTEMIDRDLGEFISSQNQPDNIPLWNALQPVVIPLSALGFRKIGQPFPVEISISDLPIDNRKIAIVRDVTERQKIQNQLEANIEELSRLSLVLANTNNSLSQRNQELDQFAYVTSHDLKAPLRAISNLSVWMEEDLEDKLPPENKHQMYLLRQRVNRMENLINGLLEYSRVGKVEIATETVNVDKLLQEIIDSLAPPPTFIIEIASQMPTLTTKRILLQQVFANLIGNAIKHHPRNDGCVKISVSDIGEFYEFTIFDDGTGISPEFHHKIFTIFQTLEARDTKESTGVGLAIVKKIVDSMGGSINVKSQLGEGTNFIFTWSK
ncbi:MAG: ATP-binding protein [Cyanobacteria bacterium P01_D01_bin.50]